MPQGKQHVRHEFIEALTRSSLLNFVGHSTEHLDELRQLLVTSQVMEFRAGTEIIHEGRRSDRMYFLASRAVIISKNNREICTLDQMGDVFGEIGAIIGEPRSASVTALTNVACLATHANFISRLPEQKRFLFVYLLQQALSKLLAERLRSTSDELTKTQEMLDIACEEIQRLKKQLAKEKKVPC